MQEAMINLADMCGFNFQASTFPELIRFFVLAVCGTAILANIIKVMLCLAFDSHKIARW